MENDEIKNIISSWFVQFSDEMYSWALFKTQKNELAEDLVQETFIAAIHSFQKFKNESTPKTWLFKILNNKIIDYYRSKNYNSETSLDKKEENSYNVTDEMFTENDSWDISVKNELWNVSENLLDNNEFNLTLASCLENLPEKWKLILLSKFDEETKTDLFCQELGISTSNYWQIVHRAKLQMKKCLDTNWFK